MMGHGSIAGMMGYGDANAAAMEIGEFEVLPVVEEVPVICGVHATDPRRRMWHWLGGCKEMGFSGMNNFPTHSIVDGDFRQILEETGMGVHKEVETSRWPARWTLHHRLRRLARGGEGDGGGRCRCDHRPRRMHRGWFDRGHQRRDAARRCRLRPRRSSTRGNQCGTTSFTCRTAARSATPADAAFINEKTDAVGFVGASSLERMAVEQSLTDLTREFKAIPVKRLMSTDTEMAPSPSSERSTRRAKNTHSLPG